jgi:spore coat protein U-like protein
MFFKLVKRMVKLALLLSLFFSSATFACLVDFDLVDTTWTMGSGAYESFENTEYTQAVQFDVNVLTTGECNYFLSFSDGGQTGYLRLAQPAVPTATISYNLYKDVELTSVLKANADFVSTSDMLFGTVTTGNSGAYSQTLYFDVPYHQIIESETYTNTIEAKLYEGDWDDLDNATLIQTKDIVFSVPVASSISISLDNNDFTSHSLISKDLGEMFANDFVNLNIYVRSNDSYKLKIQSANSETMVTNPVNETPLPYEFRVDGTLVDLSSGSAVEVLNTTVATVQEGKLYIGEFKVPQVDDVFNGTYEETLTFTVESL